MLLNDLACGFADACIEMDALIHEIPPNQREIVFKGHVSTAIICLVIALLILATMKWIDFVKEKQTDGPNRP